MNDDGMVAIAGILAVLVAALIMSIVGFAVVFICDLAGFPIH